MQKIRSLLVYVLACIAGVLVSLLSVAFAQDASSLPVAPSFNWLELGKSIAADAAVTAVNFGLPVLLLGAGFDAISRLLPPLTPFRALVLGWINAKLEEWAHQQARRSVLAHGQVYKDTARELAQKLREHGASPDDLDVLRLKGVRNENVLNELLGRGIAKDDYTAKRLIEGAVGELKAEGVNP
jgi:hypothetical protein